MFILRLTKIKVKIITLAVIFLSLALLETRTANVSRLNLPSPLEQVKTEQKVIALTVNVDWGEECIPQMLNLFEKYGAQATFFVTGRWALNNPDLVKLMAEKGHQIENHGYYHSHPDRLPVEKNKQELLKTENVIKQITGKKTTFYAPPYGERGPNGLKAAEELGYKTVLWTLDTVDWKPGSTPELIAARVLNPKVRFGIKPKKKGAIVLMHPKPNTIKALPRILSELQEDGFKFVTIEKLITYGFAGNTTSWTD